MSGFTVGGRFPGGLQGGAHRHREGCHRPGDAGAAHRRRIGISGNASRVAAEDPAQFGCITRRNTRAQGMTPAALALKHFGTRGRRQQSRLRAGPRPHHAPAHPLWCPIMPGYISLPRAGGARLAPTKKPYFKTFIRAHPTAAANCRKCRATRTVHHCAAMNIMKHCTSNVHVKAGSRSRSCHAERHWPEMLNTARFVPPNTPLVQTCAQRGRRLDRTCSCGAVWEA